MATSLPGPSTFARMDVCDVSEALPHSYARGKFDRLGSHLHAFFADCLIHGREEAVLRAPVEHQVAFESIELDRLPAFDPRAYAPEVSFAWNIRTGQVRVLGRNLTRDQARAKALPDELVGSADVAGLSATSAVVYDYKTGWGYVEPAAVNWQLKTYALMAARAWGREHATYGVIRVHLSGQPWFDTAEMNLLDLEVHEEAVLGLLARREAVRAKAARGEPLPPPVEDINHCKYCPAKASCPAKVNGIRSVLEAPRDLPLARENAAKAWHAIQLARSTLDRWETAIKDLAWDDPIPLDDDGTILGRRKKSSETILPHMTREPLQNLFGEQLGNVVYRGAVEVKECITKKALERAVREYVLPTMEKRDRKISKVMAGVLDFLRSKRAVASRSSEGVEEYRPGKELPADAPVLLPEAGADLPLEEAA